MDPPGSHFCHFKARMCAFITPAQIYAPWLSHSAALLLLFCVRSPRRLAGTLNSKSSKELFMVAASPHPVWAAQRDTNTTLFLKAVSKVRTACQTTFRTRLDPSESPLWFSHDTKAERITRSENDSAIMEIEIILVLGVVFESPLFLFFVFPNKDIVFSPLCTFACVYMSV